MASKFDALRRSQICLRLHLSERELLTTKPGSERDRELRAERAQLFAALQKRDNELFAKWEKSGFPE